MIYRHRRAKGEILMTCVKFRQNQNKAYEIYERGIDKNEQKTAKKNLKEAQN